ncbi:HNH endonuclease [Microbacterium sp. ru370.1]|uniref:HNH endonuclease n=1 Tax=unclassified Microbacterium TaxID=2609290 RepID=UPI00088C6710|nr:MULTISPECIES: HNH endonuclease signature motif containing protein [unclassified Microbacterium]SDO29100.1 HNH endonuclease [Microbacterium sp. ru370.1]SIT75449.1 HNH endonuclease [Microbacterium sp. RU1D]
MHDATSPSTPDSPTRPLSAVRDEVVRTGRVLAAAEVARARALAEAGHLALDVMAGQRTSARTAELALREVASELAAAENLSDRSLQRQITRAMSLVDDYPSTLAAWEAGTISRTHAHVIADVGQALPGAVRADLDQLAVTHAPGLSPGRLRSRLAVLAERLHPTTLTERHQRGRDTRCVRIVTGVDGMSDLVATLPTVLAVGIYDRLTQQARAVIDHRAGSALGLADPADDDRAHVHPCGGGAGIAALDGAPRAAAVGGGAGSAAGAATPVGGATRSGAIAPAPTVVTDERTTAQLRADIFADLLLTAAPGADPTRTDDGPGTLGAIRARVQVVVPALSILDPHSENFDPADLVGHGPIDARTARDLAESTTTPWDRVVTHPVTGAVLHTDTYHRTSAIDRHLRARDRHCRWPGCVVPAVRCEVDHTVDHAQGGPTTVTNLAHLCQRHHTQKQFTRWKVRQLPGGVLEWTSPTGRTYTDEPLPYSPAVRFLPDDPAPPDPQEGLAPF